MMNEKLTLRRPGKKQRATLFRLVFPPAVARLGRRRAYLAITDLPDF